MTRSVIPLLALVLIVAAAVAAGCAGTGVAPAVAGDVKKFSSVDEISEYIRNSTSYASGEGYGYNGAGIARDAAIAPAAAESSVGKGLSVPSSAGSADHSS